MRLLKNSQREVKTSRRCAVIGAIGAIVLLATSAFVAAPSAWALPPSLTGEFLGAGATSSNGGALVTSATCKPTSASTVSFTATGTVPTGFPYPGPFTESGVISVSTVPTGAYVDGIPYMTVTTLDAFFTINSPGADVTGTQHLLEPNIGGLCNDFNNSPFGNSGTTVTGTYRALSPGSDGWGESYDAIIATSSGTFEDSGVSGILIQDLNVTNVAGPAITNANAFNDAFSSSSLTEISNLGDATGGGQLNVNGNGIAFGFEARSAKTMKGQCDLVDQAAAVKLHCVDVTGFAQVSPTEVMFFGDATINGAATNYQVDTKDLADPGTGADTFMIATTSGYSASGILARGNVQIHTK